jgi:cell division protein FtsQ
MAAQAKVNKVIRGASRSSKSAPSKAWGVVVLRVIRSLIVVVAIGGGLYVAITSAVEQLDRPVASVKINGEFSRVTRQQVADEVYGSMGRSFISLDLERIQHQLETLAWVDSARIARTWPDGLNVTVIEHRPIARWGERDALNHRGEVIRLGDGEGDRALLEDLPVLAGVDGMEREVMAQYHALTKVLAEHGLQIGQLSCDGGRSWTMSLSDGVHIEMGRDQVMSRVSRFLVVFESQLQQRWAELSRVDLRYFNGVAVKWRNQSLDTEAVSKKS